MKAKIIFKKNTALTKEELALSLGILYGTMQFHAPDGECGKLLRSTIEKMTAQLRELM